MISTTIMGVQRSLTSSLYSVHRRPASRSAVALVLDFGFVGRSRRVYRKWDVTKSESYRRGTISSPRPRTISSGPDWTTYAIGRLSVVGSVQSGSLLCDKAKKGRRGPQQTSHERPEEPSR